MKKEIRQQEVGVDEEVSSGLTGIYVVKEFIYYASAAWKFTNNPTPTFYGTLYLYVTCSTKGVGNWKLKAVNRIIEIIFF